LNEFNASPWMIIEMRFLLLAFAALSVHVSSWAIEVSKAEWIEGMKTAIPAAFCSSSQYFRQCYSVTSNECEEATVSATRNCLAKYNTEIPAILVQPEDGTRMGEIIGQCVGYTYADNFAARHISNAKCNDAKNWR
jgi:hypothetical protein